MRTRRRAVPLQFALLALLITSRCAEKAVADPPRIRSLQMQEAVQGRYFRVYFDKPADLDSNTNRPAALIPQNAPSWHIYQSAVGDRLEFLGRADHTNQVEMLLIYPSVEEAPDPGSGQNQKVTVTPTWRECTVHVDLRTAVRLADVRFFKREDRVISSSNDLEDQFAVAQASHFLRLAQQSGDFGFYRFAAQATGRKYGVHVPGLAAPTAGASRDPQFTNRSLYETTTGAAAISESLQLERMLNRRGPQNEARTIDIGKVPGIDIAEHPWTKMMGDRKPSPEPTARLVPHDNYYVHFKSIRKFIEFGELLDQWGTNVTRAYEISSRDYQLRERYEKQLCLKSTWLGKTFGDKVVRELAVTGSDPYLREGSDMTVIFHVSDRNLFLAAVDPFIREARKEFADELKETKYDYRGTIVESYVTPLREVSLHRASVDRFVIYSNSPVAIRRCLETYQGRAKALADSLDFQYMRTVFRLEEEEEEGFAFLSDAFIRQLVGPASKIKEKRRLEALTTLYMVTHGALFTAWERGKPPDDLQQLQQETRLRPEDLVLPEAGELTWDGRRQAAVSDVYNTIHFATPLVELPINQITPSESEEYRRFRLQYLGLWRKYFDPVGMRFRQSDSQVRVETYILPLVRNSQYDSLRSMAGDKTIALRPSQIAPKTLAQLTLGAWSAPDRTEQFVLRLDDGPMFQQLVDWWRRGQQSQSREWWQEALRMFFQLPVVFGIEELQDPEKLVKDLERLGDDHLTVRREKIAYHGETITKAVLKADIIGFAMEFIGLGDLKPKEDQSIYYVLIEKAWYVSFSETAIKGVIDQATARRNAAGKEEKAIEVNSSLYIAPKAFDQARAALHYFLESETQRRALTNNAILYPIYRTGILAKDAPEADMRSKAFGWYGFIPVSPDGATYRYDAKTDEVVNARHGSLRNPLLHAAPADGSLIAQLLDQLQTLRADLRFREDGVQTVLTIERKAVK